MSSPSRRRDYPPRDRDASPQSVSELHLQIIQELRDLQNGTSQQINDLTRQVTELVGVVKATQNTQTEHDKRIEAIETRERARETTARAQGFTLGNNAIMWVLMVGIALLSIVLSGHIALR